MSNRMAAERREQDDGQDGCRKWPGNGQERAGKGAVGRGLWRGSGVT